MQNKGPEESATVSFKKKRIDQMIDDMWYEFIWRINEKIEVGISAESCEISLTYF